MTRVGSPLWLLRHELRLAWRGMGGKGIALTLILGGVLSAALHVAVYFLLRGIPAGVAPPWASYVLGGAAWLAFSLMLSQAIAQSVSALFVRGDLDLLLASPLPTRTVFLVRGLGIALSVIGVYLFLLAPVAHMGVFTGHAQLLAIYPALAALALGATALGLALTLGLVRLLGARRARTVAQVFGALVGALMFLASQVNGFLGRATRERWASRIAEWAQDGGPLAPDSPLWFPGRALLGEALPLLALVLVGGGAFWFVVGLAHRRFLSGTQETVTGSARRGAAAAGKPSRFRAGLARNVLAKEWRLIVRDPQLITQTLLQLLYLAPLVLLMMRGEGKGLALLAPGAVWLAASLAGNLAWITMAAEDAPDLLGSSPNDARRLQWLKLLAAVLPVWLLLSPLAMVLLASSPWQAAAFVFGLVGGTVSLGLAQIWYPRQGKREDLKHRGKQNIGMNLLELLISLAWAGTTYCLLARPLWAPGPLLLALLGLAAVHLLGRSRRGGATA